MSNKIKRLMNAYMLLVKKAKIIQQKSELKSKVSKVTKLISNNRKKG